jgi:hypothetical protein
VGCGARGGADDSVDDDLLGGAGASPLREWQEGGGWDECREETTRDVKWFGILVRFVVHSQDDVLSRCHTASTHSLGRYSFAL